MPSLSNNLSHITNQRLFLAIFLCCCFLMSFGFYLQYHLDLEPCPLCMTQRVFIVLCGLLALLGATHNPKPLGTRVYASLILLTTVAGGYFSSRQLYLQGLPEDKVPACGPSLSYMLEAFPLSKTLTAMLTGDGNCAEVVWTFLGLSIPAWALLAFISIAGCTLYLLRSNRHGHAKP